MSKKKEQKIAHLAGRIQSELESGRINGGIKPQFNKVVSMWQLEAGTIARKPRDLHSRLAFDTKRALEKMHGQGAIIKVSYSISYQFWGVLSCKESAEMSVDDQPRPSWADTPCTNDALWPWNKAGDTECPESNSFWIACYLGRRFLKANREHFGLHQIDSDRESNIFVPNGEYNRLIDGPDPDHEFLAGVLRQTDHYIEGYQSSSAGAKRLGSQTCRNDGIRQSKSN